MKNNAKKSNPLLNYSVCSYIIQKYKYERSLPVKPVHFWHLCGHYETTPMYYRSTAIFHGCKNDNFQTKNCDVFLIVAQNIDCGYT